MALRPAFENPLNPGIGDVESTFPGPHTRARVWGAEFFAFLLFLCVKVPLLFAPLHWEELRDTDAFLRLAQGELPYSDYYWHYGPVSLFLYGIALKVLPPLLVSVRFITLILNSVVFVLCYALLARYLRPKAMAAVAAILATGIVGIPNYSHNHALIQLLLLGSVYFAVKYTEKGNTKDLYLSFLLVLGVFGTRPVLTGYASLVGWSSFFLIANRRKGWRVLGRDMGFFASSTAVFFAVWYLLLGAAFMRGFLPRPAAIYPPGTYPNLYGVASLLNGFGSLADFLRALRTALDVCFFHFHFFIWPAILGTLVYLRPQDTRGIFAFCLWGMSLVASLEVLYHGDAAPQFDPILLTRGQYFLVLSFSSVLVMAWPSSFAPKAAQFWLRIGLIGSFTLWSWMPWISTVHKYLAAERNPLEFSILKGIGVHPTLRPVMEALKFASAHCEQNKPIFFGLYSPGHARLTGCEDILKQDDHLLDFPDSATVRQGDSPYCKQKNCLVSEIIDARVASQTPQVLVVLEGSRHAARCDAPGWNKKVFPHWHGTRLVCWQG